ncbi:putative protein kinase [Leptomonas seymouri]|uniref:Protein kinase domain-containing protein n=1 Tax=Leptomonas seymouri TaxID=5684 RepID=A0A0N1I7H0_LEPSE|nr:putative protein kinase [Leptomonas seymouri]|eukprot:KPI89463.1 putative protein kinase [Leptomonas seymouri]
MGNQLAATPTVDLANVSSDLELIAPLGAEGRNYFATFHCLHYTPLSSTAPSGGSSATSSSPLSPHPNFSSSDNAPRYSTDFISADGSSKPSGYQPSSLYYPSARTSSSSVTANPLMRGVAREREGGGGKGGDRRGLYNAPASTTRFGEAAFTAATPTTRIASIDRAAWHQARWRQRLRVATRPWRVVPSHFVSEAAQERPPPGDVMDRWCRDSTVASYAFSRSSAGRFDARADNTSTSTPLASHLSPLSLSPLPSSIARGNTARSTDIDATVAGVVGEWRGNYGNYVQLLLRGGSSVNHSSATSAALCEGQICQMEGRVRSAASNTGAGYVTRSALTATKSRTMPSALSVAGNNDSNGVLQMHPQSYVMHDVVTKIFVRTPDDPGQTYFIQHVRQMMGSAREQLSAVDSTLEPTALRNCLWYTLVYEGDGFCVLQRPYVAFTLRERLAARPGWSAQERLFTAFQILQAVAHLHETYGLTHGDIKPNNVLVQSTGVVVLCDMAPFKPWRLPLDSPLLFDYYYDTDESRACYLAPEKFSDQPLPSPPLESRTPGNATYNVRNLNFDGHTAAMDIFSTACVLLFLYKEEDPFTLSEVLHLHHLSSAEQREKAILPVLQDSRVPLRLQSLLRLMLCSPSADRLSARELLARAVEEKVFPACFAYLYEDVFPRLLTQPPDARLRLLQNQLETILQRCAMLDAGLPVSGAGEGQDATGIEPAVVESNNAAAACDSRAAAVSLLLPLLLQTVHSTETSDEATFRGLLCLRQCVTYCSFTALTDFVLPHLVYLANNEAHVYGPATRLVAIRLLCSVSETVAQRLTAPQPSLQERESSTQLFYASTETLLASCPPGEEQWSLMEHLVLPCFYDILRQGEQESVAVLVELAGRLPRLLLLTRFLTERRQVLYGAEDSSSVAQKATVSPCKSLNSVDLNAQREGRMDLSSAVAGTVRPGTMQAESISVNQEKRTLDDVSEAPVASVPTPQQGSNRNAETSANDGRHVALCQAEACEVAEKNVVEDNSMQASEETTLSDREEAVRSNKGLDVPGSSTTGALQYLTQLHCLLTNGWNMLLVLYNHPCVAVSAAVMQQTSSTVAAFLGDERVADDLIPLLTTALTAPLRVLRSLFPQAILLHAVLQMPQTKTLRVFVDEGLRHSDDVCLKSTLDSLAVVVRCRRLPLEESMTLVHQSLPFLMDNRLWLREAACGVVEAAAQSYPASAVALHLGYAVRPLLTHPVPLSQLRRFAASIIRSELAASCSASGCTPASPQHRSVLHRDVSGGGGVVGGSRKLTDWRLLADKGAGEPTSNLVIGDVPHGSNSSDACSENWFVDYRDALPSVVSAATNTAPSAAPALLHTLPPTQATTIIAATSVSDPAPSDGTEGTGDLSALNYRLAPREAARIKIEVEGIAASNSMLQAQLSSSASSAPASACWAGASKFLSLQESPIIAAAPPHEIHLGPFPRTLAPHSSLSPPDATARANGSAVYNSPFVACSPPAPSVFPSATAAAAPPLLSSSSSATLRLPASTATAASITPARYSALRPIAVPITSVSAHMGAIYTAAAAPSANGAVVTAGARGEAMIWRVGAAFPNVASSRDLSLVERVSLPAMAASTTGALAFCDFSYVASQWMDVAPQRRDNSCIAAAPATTNTVALTSTDGVVRVLDVERNTWLWSSAVGGGEEGAPTGLALHDRCSLLVTTAAGGLHVVDTRCGSGGAGSTSRTAPANSPLRGDGVMGGGRTPFASVWSTRLQPLNGVPSCVLPLYSGDRACAAVVGTYGGVVCLFDLRYNLCAQRIAMNAAVSPSLPSQSLSITCACVDPLSSLCRGCRPSSWEPAVPGPSILLATTAGTVFRLLLQANGLGAYWPAFQCARDSAAGVRCMLSQPSRGSVLTGSEEGYIQHWSTDHPEKSHTVTATPYVSPPYTVSRNPLAAAADQTENVEGSALRFHYGTKRLAALTVCEGVREARYASPHHAPDAILALCAVLPAEFPSRTWSGAKDGQPYLLSGARDGSLTLWNNME